MDALYLDKKILIIDDDEDDFIITGDYIHSIPGSSFKIDWSKKYDDGVRHLINRDYDLYLVDYRLGAKSGVDFLKDALLHDCDEPIVLLTGKGNYNIDLQSMQLGAVDYLVKTELTTEKLERCIRYALGRSSTLKALKANERKYRSIFENSKDVVFVTDNHLNFKEVNPAVYKMLGYDKDEILRMNLLDLLDKHTIKQSENLFSEHLSEVNDKELILITKDGDRKYCALTLAREEDSSNVSYVQGILHDITSLKIMEKAAIQTEKLAAAGRLLRTIAHEVRNPLNNISLSTEQLQQDIKDNNSIFYLDIIHRNTRRISDLISELLSTSKPSGISTERLIFQNVIDDVIAASIDRLTLKSINVSLSYPENNVDISADRNNLKLAILNIVINAIEAMEDKTGKLSINLVRDNNDAILTISDNGCGISEDNLTRLFEPFFTQKRNGVGLGLPFTLNILQAHKAHIAVSSQINKGTTFKITFPILSE